jgi:hypothetical protein
MFDTLGAIMFGNVCLLATVVAATASVKWCILASRY